MSSSTILPFCEQSGEFATPNTDSEMSPKVSFAKNSGIFVINSTILIYLAVFLRISDSADSAIVVAKPTYIYNLQHE